MNQPYTDELDIAETILYHHYPHCTITRYQDQYSRTDLLLTLPVMYKGNPYFNYSRKITVEVKQRRNYSSSEMITNGGPFIEKSKYDAMLQMMTEKEINDIAILHIFNDNTYCLLRGNRITNTVMFDSYLAPKTTDFHNNQKIYKTVAKHKITINDIKTIPTILQ